MELDFYQKTFFLKYNRKTKNCIPDHSVPKFMRGLRQHTNERKITRISNESNVT